MMRAIPTVVWMLSLASLAGAGQAPTPGAPVTLTVLNFVSRHPGDGWDWLEKGLADMLTTDLSASPRLRLIERERVQMVLDELRLVEAGLVEEKSAARL